MQFEGKNGKTYEIPRMSYEDIREYMEHKLAHGMRGTLTESEVKLLVDQWVDDRSEEELNEEVVKKELKKLELKLEKYNVPAIGNTEEEK